MAHGNTGVVQKALEQLRTVERAARERSELKRAGVKIAKAYALAGEYDAAHNVAKEVTDEPWEANRAIGVALSAAGRRREAASMLAKAWRGLEDPSYWGLSSWSVPCESLSEIGIALARIGELKAARSVADDLADCEGRLDTLPEMSIYTAILEYAPAP